jgi:hypothetical protein
MCLVYARVAKVTKISWNKRLDQMLTLYELAPERGFINQYLI